jgi:hypothetical protein
LIKGGDDLLADAIEHGVVEESGNQVEIRTLADYRTGLEFDLDTLAQVLREIAGRDIRVTVGRNLTEADLSGSPAGGTTAKTSGSGSRDAGAAKTAPGEAAGRALADPEVQKYQELFEGRVREVRDLRGYSS